MFDRILIPLDLTNSHDQALSVAREISRSKKGKVVLLHVIELIPMMPLEEDRAFYGTLEKRAESHMEALRKKYGDGTSRWTTRILFGDRAREVIRFARLKRIDLIILSSHRVDAGHPVEGLGTLSHKIGILAPCAVLMVKGAVHPSRSGLPLASPNGRRPRPRGR